MSKQHVPLVKVMYYSTEFSVIASAFLTNRDKIEMVKYVKEIGDVAFIVDGDVYLDQGAVFNLTMKYFDHIEFT